MKQKLGLSCALIHQPPILLLDEPTFGVDPVSRRELWLIVHEMVAQGVTAVVSTAYMDEAERFDRVALLHHGKLLALDTPAQLRSSLSGPLYTLVVDRPRAARDAIAGAANIRHAVIFGDRLHVTVDPAAADAAAAIRDALAPSGLAITELRPSSASLEDVFMEQIAAADVEAA
jgi:ABC-2 type transport system ATP-binding protein